MMYICLYQLQRVLELIFKILFLHLLFIYFWLCWVFVALHGLFLGGVRGSLLFSCHARASHCGGFSCGTRPLERRLNSCGALASQHVKSSGDQSHVPSISRWILTHCATREVWELIFLISCFSFYDFN